MAETVYWSKNAVATVGPSGETNFDDAREAAESTSNTNNTTSSNIQSTRFGIFTGRVQQHLVLVELILPLICLVILQEQ